MLLHDYSYGPDSNLNYVFLSYVPIVGYTPECNPSISPTSNRKLTENVHMCIFFLQRDSHNRAAWLHKQVNASGNISKNFIYL